MFPFMDLRLPFHLESLYPFIGQYPSSSVLLIDQDGSIVRTSASFLQATEYTADELQGKPYGEIILFEGTLSDLFARCASFQGDGSSTDKLPVVQIKARSGKLLSSEVVVANVMDGGSVQASVMYLPNLISQKNLTILQQFSGSLMQNVNLGVMLMDTDGRIVEVSDMACQILGRQRECLLNNHMDEIFASVPPEHRLVNPSILKGAVVRNHAVHWRNETQGFDLLIDSNVLRGETGEIVGAYVIMKDVSNLRSLEAQLQRNDRLATIGQIAAGTAHEIRNPLTSLKGFIQLLQTSLENKQLDKEAGYLQIMKNEINRINDLVSEFLLLGKPKDVQYKPISITRTIREILPIIESEANLHSISVWFKPEPDLPKAVADSELLKQVFLNICKNAIEAMENSGSLTIMERMNAAEQLVHIDIHDTGPGIPGFMIDKIFDPFFTTKENGTGLGLAVCQRIIHDMGGQIRVRNKGDGTTFTVTLPFSR